MSTGTQRKLRILSLLAREPLTVDGVVAALLDDHGSAPTQAAVCALLGRMLAERLVSTSRISQTPYHITEQGLDYMRSAGATPEPPPLPVVACAAVEPDPERSCYGKHRYTTEAEAKRVSALATARRHTPLRVYACTVCGGYHLTKQVDRPEAAHG